MKGIVCIFAVLLAFAATPLYAAPAKTAPAAAPAPAANDEVHTGLGDPAYDEYDAGNLEYDEQEGEDEVDYEAANMEVHSGEGDPEEAADEADEAEAEYSEYPEAGNLEEEAE